MSLLRIFVLFITVNTTLALAQMPVDFISEKQSLFKNNEHILTLDLHKKMHPEDKELLLFWLQKYLGEEIVIVKEVGNKPITNKYFLGFKGKIKIILEYPNHIYKNQKFLAERLCYKLKCDFVFRGDYIKSYSYPTYWDHSQNSQEDLDLFFIKQYKSLFINKHTSMTMKKKLYSQLAYELTYWGSPGEVIHYNLPENTPDLPESGNFFEIEQMPFHLSGEMLSENQLDYLLNHSNADCVYSSIKITLKHCKGGENKQFPEVSELPQKLILKIQEGTSEIEFLEDYPRQSLRESIIRDADADVIYDPEFIRMATREKKQSYAGFIKEHKSKYSWINNNSNLIVEYFKSDEIQLRMKLKNNSKIDNERLHELIVEGTAPEYFKIYAWKTDNSLSYLGQHEANIVPALERSSERKLKIQPSYYVGVKGESRSLKINTSSNTLNFMERNKSNAFTFYNFYAGWWAPESNFGFKGHFQLFNYRYNVKNLLGNDTITNGSMDEVNIMGSYRFSHKSKWSDYITLSLGVNRKNILVTKNISLGDIKFLSVPVEMNFLKKYKKFVFSGGAQLAKVLKAEGKFDLSSTGGDGDGFWYGFETQAAYPVFKNTFITLGTNLRKTKVSFPAGELDMNEMGFYVGLEYLNIGF